MTPALVAVLLALAATQATAHDWIGVQDLPDCACKGVELNCTNADPVVEAFDTLVARKCNETTTKDGEVHPNCHLDETCQQAYWTVIAHRYGEWRVELQALPYTCTLLSSCTKPNVHSISCCCWSACAVPA